MHTALLNLYNSLTPYFFMYSTHCYDQPFEAFFSSFITAHQALADVHALKECLFKTEIKQTMSGIEIRSARQEKKEWQTRTKIRLDTKKLMFHFGKTISHNIARKMAMGGVCYTEIEEIFVKNNNKEAFHDAMNGKLKLSRVTRDKIFNHFLQFSKRA